MTHPTTEQSIRERLARAMCKAERPMVDPDRIIDMWAVERGIDDVPQRMVCAPLREWHKRIAILDAILAELQEPSLHAELRQASKGMLTDVQLHGLWDCVRHIWDGGS